MEKVRSSVASNWWSFETFRIIINDCLYKQLMQITDLDKSQRQTFINHQKRNPVYKWTTFVTITRTKLYESSCAIPDRHDRLWFNPNFWKSLQPDGHNSYLHVGIRYQPEKGLASCFISLKIMQFSTRGTFPRHQQITNGHWIPGLEKVINRSARVPILLKQSDAIPVCLQQRSQNPNRRGRSSQQTEAFHTPVPTVSCTKRKIGLQQLLY